MRDCVGGDESKARGAQVERHRPITNAARAHAHSLCRLRLCKCTGGGKVTFEKFEAPSCDPLKHVGPKKHAAAPASHPPCRDRERVAAGMLIRVGEPAQLVEQFESLMLAGLIVQSQAVSFPLSSKSCVASWAMIDADGDHRPGRLPIRLRPARGRFRPRACPAVPPASP